MPSSPPGASDGMATRVFVVVSLMWIRLRSSLIVTRCLYAVGWPRSPPAALTAAHPGRRASAAAPGRRPMPQRPAGSQQVPTVGRAAGGADGRRRRVGGRPHGAAGEAAELPRLHAVLAAADEDGLAGHERLGDLGAARVRGRGRRSGARRPSPRPPARGSGPRGRRGGWPRARRRQGELLELASRVRRRA